MKVQRAALVVLGIVFLVIAFLVSGPFGTRGEDGSRPKPESSRHPGKSHPGERPSRGALRQPPLEETEAVRNFQALLEEWDNPSIRSTDDLAGALHAAIAKMAPEEAEWFVRRWTRSELQAGMRDPLVGWMLSRWMDEGSGEAAVVLASRHESREDMPALTKLLESAVEALGRGDPEVVVPVLHEVRAILDGNESSFLVDASEVLARYAARNPDQAWGTLLGLKPEEQVRSVSGFVAGLPDDSDWPAIAHRIGATFGGGADRLPINDEERRLLRNGVVRLASRWAETDPGAALAWFHGPGAGMLEAGDGDRVAAIISHSHRLINAGVNADTVRDGLRHANLTAEERERVRSQLETGFGWNHLEVLRLPQGAP